MVQINFKMADGSQRTVEALPGESIMNVAVRSGLPGIGGDCGGNCACATCHVLVAGSTPVQRNAEEAAMLAIVDERQQSSRLGCQITVSEELNGFLFEIP